MKKPTISGQKKILHLKGKLADGYNWKLDNLVFDKEEKRRKKLCNTKP